MYISASIARTAISGLALLLDVSMPSDRLISGTPANAGRLKIIAASPMSREMRDTSPRSR
jgi:hypothetical protein